MKSVVICGSQRFKEPIAQFVSKLKKLGVPVVFEPNFDRRPKKFINKKERERLQSPSYAKAVPAMVHQHFNRIRKTAASGGVCYIFNKDGYIGSNTSGELGFAHGLNMIVYAKEPECHTEKGGEIWRSELFTEIVESAEELVERLRQ